MKTNYTHITMLLDRSGSMDDLKADVIGGVNSFIEEQEKVGETTLTLVQFDDRYEVILNGVDLRSKPRINSEVYYPRGWTALYDAAARAIDETGIYLSSKPLSARPEKVVFLIFTDGAENSSTEHNAEAVKRRIEHQRDKYKWEFVFMGANQDAILAAGHIGIAPAASMTYTASGLGTGSVLRAMSSNVNSFKSGAVMSASFTAQQRSEQDALAAREDAQTTALLNALSNTGASKP